MFYLAAELAKLQNANAALKQQAEDQSNAKPVRRSPNRVHRKITKYSGALERHPDILLAVRDRNAGKGWQVNDLRGLEPKEKTLEAFAKWAGWERTNPYMKNFGSGFPKMLELIPPKTTDYGSSGWRVVLLIEGEKYRLEIGRLLLVLSSGNPSWKEFFNRSRVNYGQWMSFEFQTVLSELFNVSVDAVRPTFTKYQNRPGLPETVEVAFFDPYTGVKTTKVLDTVIALMEERGMKIPPLFAFKAKVTG